MHVRRATKRKISAATIVLMVLQVFGSAMAMARDVRSAALHAEGKQIVICSVHGTMVVDWDGPAPAKKPARGCPFCLSGAGITGANAPDIALIVIATLLPVPDIASTMSAVDRPELNTRIQERPSSPRAPPAIA